MKSKITERHKLKNPKGKKLNKGITLIALIITIIVLLILAGVSIATLTGDNGILTKAAEAREATRKAEARELIEIETIGSYGTDGKVDIDELKANLKKNLGLTDSDIVDTDGGFPVTVTYNGYSFTVEENGNVRLAGTVVTPAPEPTPIDPEDIETGGATFTRANGKIDIQFLTGTSYTVAEENQANAPLIDTGTEKMIPVNWDNTNKNWVVTDEEDWDYSYGETDTTKKWANVMLRDTLVLEGMDNTAVQTATIADMKGKAVTTEGSMLVWLPRYAYKITYYAEDDTAKTGSPVGYSDARGLVDAEGKTPEGMAEPVTSISVGEYYRPHPAFETDLSQGGWSTKLEGIWMGKFETTGKVNDKITVRPNTASYVSQTIGTFYTDARNLGIANSHMTKNSEWGAMAYLTESKYGRNGTAVTKNDAKVNSKITTGEGAYITNVDQSTTGNVYGIYDTVGGSYEYVAGYIADSSRDDGNSFASTNPEANDATNDNTTNTQYATVYEMAESNSYTENYTANINNKFGDGIIETSTSGSVLTSWHSAYSFFVGVDSSGNYPFFLRGGSFNNPSARSFYFGNGNGRANSFNSFRVCASVQ